MERKYAVAETVTAFRQLHKVDSTAIVQFGQFFGVPVAMTATSLTVCSALSVDMLEWQFPCSLFMDSKIM